MSLDKFAVMFLRKLKRKVLPHDELAYKMCAGSLNIFHHDHLHEATSIL